MKFAQTSFVKQIEEGEAMQLEGNAFVDSGSSPPPGVLPHSDNRLTPFAVRYCADGPTDQPQFKLYTADDLETLPDTEWLVHNILPRGGLTLLFGDSGAGKSFVAIDLSLSIATGRKWLGRASMSGPVVYIVGEGWTGIRKRVVAWKRFHGEGSIQNAHFLKGAVQLRQQAPELLATIIDKQPVLIVIDTLAQCFVGGDENAQKDMGEFIAAAQRIQRETGATVLLLHHSTKKSGNNGQRPVERGSSALRAACDAVLAVTRQKGRTKLSSEKEKDEEAFPAFTLTDRKVTIGKDANGESITSLVLVPAEEKDDTREEIVLPLNHREALDALKGLGGRARLRAPRHRDHPFHAIVITCCTAS